MSRVSNKMLKTIRCIVGQSIRKSWLIGSNRQRDIELMENLQMDNIVVQKLESVGITGKSLEGIMDLNIHTENNVRFLFHIMHKNKLQEE